MMRIRRCVDMIQAWKAVRRPLIFAAIGAAAGLIYYLTVGCTGGNCAISSNILSSMIFPGIMGMSLGVISKGGCCCGGGSCDIDER